MRNVVGTAMLILWPMDSWTVLRNPGDTFADPEHQGPDRPDDPEAELVPIIVRPRSRP